MRLFKSIRWRLQLWYGLILVVVLAGFGLTAYQLERGRQMRRVDEQLQHRFDVLALATHPPPRGPEPRGLPFNRPPAGTPPDDEMPGPRVLPPLEFHLPPQAEGLFDANDPDGFYFVIWDRDGKEIARSGNLPTHFVIEFHSGVNLPPRIGKPAPITLDNFGSSRRLIHTLPSGEQIRVGVSIKPELTELRLTAFTLTAVGGVILLFGLAGGWWFTGRTLRPIAAISATAVKISAGDLSQRINAAETESELGQLASVLNSTFARLETAFAQQRQFTADAAHELRTPVSVMLTQTQTALQRERSATEYREAVEACQRAAQRMRRLTESLLELARFEAGQECLQRQKFNLAQTARDCVELVRPLASERGIKIHCDLPPVEASGDAERLAQVITNLLANAVQYNQPNGEIRISTKVQGSTILLAVSDTGPGISREHLPRIFERFYRADPSRSSGQAGLGLAISKAIVEAHGGSLEVSSQPGVGTTFTVVLPAS